MPDEPFFHITEPALWDDAQVAGEYTWSTRGTTLFEVGYIHNSYRHQIESVANFVYADRSEDLVLLQIDPARVCAEIRVESLDGGSERFPHIYGPLPCNAVLSIHRMVRHGDQWRLPDDL